MRVSRAADAAEYLIGIKMKPFRNGKLTAREYILARLARAKLGAGMTLSIMVRALHWRSFEAESSNPTEPVKYR